MKFVDCPGFEDSRGKDIKIANSENIYHAISVAKSVKLVFVLRH